jgi:WhiB family transcriptional regulator, redox-sensing transcriptional regulator
MDVELARVRLASPRRTRRPVEGPNGWREMGNCRDRDPNLFYPLGRGAAAAAQAEEAKVLCRTCPSREPCLAFALSTHQELGVWGGMAADERRRLLRSRRTSVAS